MRERPEGYTTPGETRTGFILGRDRQPMEVTYEIHNGLAIWEGDIIIGRASEIATTRAALLAPSGGGARTGNGARFGVVIDGDAFRWPGGVVPYEIDPGLPDQSRVTDAIAMVEQATAGVNLVPRSGEDDYIRFVSSDGCSSSVGRIGGMQDINLDVGCTVGNTAHEILHALAMYHEHTRCDRDTYVEVLWDNIEEGKEHNFEKQCDDASDMFDYAEGSIMHYGIKAFSKNNLATLHSLRDLDDLMGQRSGLGTTDIQTINALYGAFNVAPTAAIAALASSYPEGSAVSFNGSGSSDPDDAVLTYSWDFGDGVCAGAPCTAMNPSHTYVDNGVYTVTLTVSDGFATDNAVVTATITNANPLVNAGTDVTLTSSQVFNFSGTFSDAGVIDYPWSYTINWGFGSNTIGTTNNQSAAITASRQVCVPGTYNVVLSVTDKDGGAGSDALSLTVDYFGVSIDITPTQSPNAVNIRKGGLLAVAILSTSSFDATALDPSTLYLGDEIGTDTPVAQKKGGVYQVKIEDANGDGRLDLVAMFSVPALLANGDLTASSTQLVLHGLLLNGCTNVRAVDAVVIVS
jgi:PKD repeat protein